MKVQFVFLFLVSVLLYGLTSQAAGQKFQGSFESCSKINGLLDQLKPQVDAALAHGDWARLVAVKVTDGVAVSEEDLGRFFDESVALDNGLEQLSKTVLEIDRQIPAAGSDISLQLIHLKIGLGLEPVSTYRKTLLYRQMATARCNPGPELSACEAKCVAPSFILLKNEVRKEVYSEFAIKLKGQLDAMSKFLGENVCH